jgi:hypothetical protein
VLAVPSTSVDAVVEDAASAGVGVIVVITSYPRPPAKPDPALAGR